MGSIRSDVVVVVVAAAAASGSSSEGGNDDDDGAYFDVCGAFTLANIFATDKQRARMSAFFRNMSNFSALFSLLPHYHHNIAPPYCFMR